MGLAISRMDVIHNQTNYLIEIREVREADDFGRYGDNITLQPGESKEVAATKYTSRSDLSSRSSFLKIFVNGNRTDASLGSGAFVHFSKIVFRCPAGAGKFTIYGIPAKPCDLRRIRCLGCRGRDYNREEKIIDEVSFPASSL